MKQVRTVTVLGAGTMGHGIAHAAVSSGFETRMYDVSDAAVSRGRAQIEGVFKKSVELGKATTAEADASLARLSTGTDLATALAGTDLVIEAAPEKIDLKLELMAAIDRHAPADAIVSTNTSALSITVGWPLARRIRPATSFTSGSASTWPLTITQSPGRTSMQ